MFNYFFIAAALLGSFAAEATEAPGAAAREPASAEAVAIYGLFLDHWSDQGGKTNVADAVAVATDQELADFSGCLKDLKLVRPGGGAPQSLLGTALSTRADVALVDASTWHATDPGDLIASGQAVDKAVEQGMDAGLLSLSAIVFDEQHKTAVFSFGFVCGRLCGNGGTVVFDLTASGWKRRDIQCGGWVSAIETRSTIGLMAREA
jgi:hypothetical protein